MMNLILFESSKVPYNQKLYFFGRCKGKMVSWEDKYLYAKDCYHVEIKESVYIEGLSFYHLNSKRCARTVFCFYFVSFLWQLLKWPEQ